MKKILFISDVKMSNPSSGSEQVLHNQIIGLRRFGYSISAISRDHQKAPTSWRGEQGGLEVCYYANPAKPLDFAFRVLKNPGQIFDRLSVEGTFRAVVSHQPYTCFSLVLSGRIRHIPIVYVFHSPSHEEYLIAKGEPAGFFSKCQAAVRRAIEGFCLKRSRRIMVLSRFMKQKVTSLYGISAEKIIVNPGAVDIDRFTPALDRLHSKVNTGFRGNCLHLLTVRNLEPRMGLENLIEAIDLLKKRGVECQLIIGGRGPEKACLESMVQRRGLRDMVSLVGYIPAARLSEYYSAADFFIIPTRVLEGFGLVTPESMACGTPVLGTPVGGIKEVLSNFNKEFLFKSTLPSDIAQGIEAVTKKIFSNESKYQSLRKDCREFVRRHYTWERHCQKLHEVIVDISPNNTC